ncbi:gas vesicle protein [Amycolatopsis sp. YIM 10]|uniref:gas vesicle protein n=1 Tax=Amycolatopsis sp. YIM 10 TaxID=2653857 RepID=UPI0012906F96|nr:gas vesicle protein [Amycolatopsis sp. YIM 10]QFU91176.1 Gas vesicle structural protein [Amycolatopsis sp. YIM 10]
MDGSSNSLADVLERVLDKGIVIVGDISVSVVDIELLTLKLRLFIASAQTAKEMGMDWWTGDPFFAPGRSVETGQPPAQALEEQNTLLRNRVFELEQALEKEPRR